MGHNKEKSKPFFIFYLANILLGILILIVAFVVFVIIMCQLESIDYEGIEYSQKPEVENYIMSDAMAYNTFVVWAQNNFTEKKQIPFVESYNTKIVGIHKLKIIVKEKEIAGVSMVAENKYVYFDTTGTVCEISDRYIEGITVVEGIDLKDIKVGSPLPVEERKFNMIVDVINSLNELKLDAANIVFKEDNTVSLRFGDIYAYLGSSDYILEKINRIPTILEKLKDKAGILHFEEWSTGNTDIVFEEN